MTGFVTFEISGDKLDFDDISNNIRVQPTNIYKKGDTSEKYGLVVQSADRWIYEVEFGENQNLNDVLMSFISTLSYEKKYVKEICKVNQTLWCDIYSGFVQCFSHGEIR